MWFKLLGVFALISLIVSCRTTGSPDQSSGVASKESSSPVPTVSMDSSLPDFFISITFDPSPKEVQVPGYTISETLIMTPSLQTRGVIRTIPDFNGETDYAEVLPPSTSKFTTSYIFTNKSNTEKIGFLRLYFKVVKLIPLNLGGLDAYGVTDQPSATVYDSYEPGPTLAPGVSWPFTRTVAVPGCGIYEQTFGLGQFYTPIESRIYIAIPDPKQPGCDFSSILARVKQP